MFVIYVMLAEDFNTQSDERRGFLIGILVAQISVFTAAVVGLIFGCFLG